MNRSFYYTFLLSVSLVFVVVSCKKERTLNADLTVVNATDGSPISGAKIFYEYVSETKQFKEEVGTTDTDGKFQFSRKIGKLDTYTKFRIRAEGYENVYTNGFEVELNPGKSNTVEKELYPCYHYLFSLKNLNCLNGTDSLWVNNLHDYQPYALLFTGCVDTSLHFFNEYPYTFWSYLDSKTVHFTLKRNGVVTTFQQEVNMLFNQVTPISVVY